MQFLMNFAFAAAAASLRRTLTEAQQFSLRRRLERNLKS
jgi:hypothetical protein